MAEYIEREAALALAESEEYLTPDGDEIYHEYIPVSAVKSIPAADVRPVVRGRWELSDEKPYIRKHYHPASCSNCHRAGKKGWNFCPVCGAMMEES